MSKKDEDKPHLKLVAANDQKAIKRNRAAERVGSALRQLTANLMRVSRGAGKSYEIGPQCQAVIDLFHVYRDEVGHWPSSDELDRAIRIREPEYDLRLPVEAQERIECNASMISGSLQVAASKLLHQGSQEAMGRREMSDALKRLIDQKEKRLIARLMKNSAKSKSKKADPKKDEGYF